MTTTTDAPEIPLTQLQEAYLQGRDPHVPLGGVGTAGHYDYECSVDPEVLEQAINTVVQRHEMMRMVACPRRHTQRPIIPPHYRVPVTDLQHLTGDEAEQQLAEIRRKRVLEVMDVTTWPCFRFAVILLPHGRQIVGVDFDLFFLDGPSIFALLQEIWELITDPSSRASGHSTDKPRFMDLCKEIEARGSRRRDKDQEFWSALFSSAPEPPSLPLGRTPAGEPTGIFRRVREVLTIDEWRKLKDNSRKHGVPPIGTIVESYVDALRRWSGAPEFTLNFTTSNRPGATHAGAHVLGEYTSTMLFPVEAPLGDHWTDARALARELSRLLAHRGYSGMSVAKDLKPQLGQNLHLAAPVVFTGMLMDSRGFNDGSTAFGPVVWSVSSTPQVLIDCQVIETSNDVSISLDYREPYVDQRTARAILDDMMAMLRSCCSGTTPEAAVLLPDEDQRLWAEVNSTAWEHSDELLHDMVEASMTAHPDRHIIRDDQGWHTNRELLEEAETIRASLVDMGIGVGDYVAIDGHRRARSIAAMLAVMKAGAAYIPLDPHQPDLRHQQILDSSEACAQITSTGIESLRKGSGSGSGPATSDPAYAIFTSGTTGTPKGVVISHRSVVNTVLDVLDSYDIGPGDRIAGVSSFSFDLSVFDIHGTLASQAQLILYPDQRDIPCLADGLCRDGITVWNTVPAIMGLVTAELERRSERLLQPYWRSPEPQYVDVPWDLRLVLMSGDWIPVDLPDRIRALAPSARVMSLGGATEGTIWSIWFDIGEIDPDWRTIPYGHAMRNQSMWVVDHRLRLAPVGCVGEICIGGQGVASGYLNAPNLTDRAFVTTSELGRIYRTGDYGLLDPDGEIRFLGRRDSQVKLNGHRIELSEVESSIIRSFPVSRACAAVKEVPHSGKKTLCVYYTGDTVLSLAEVREQLRSRLPGYMIPSHVIRMDQLPMTANSKVDTALLPTPTRTSSADSTKEVMNPREALVKELWCTILDEKSLGLDDDLFDLGADSLNIIQFHSQLRDAGITSLSVYDIFENPTVRGLALLIPQTCRIAKQPTPPTRLWTSQEHAKAWNSLGTIGRPPVSRILLTGATGYLGSYLLREELERGVEIWCLVRASSARQAQARVEDTLIARFGDRIPPDALARIHAIPGDITALMLGMSESALSSCSTVDAVIHAAADVSHFAAPGLLSQVNGHAMGNVIEVARRLGCRLFHVSTSQVMGIVEGGQGIFGELSHNVGQKFVDQYSSSKFLAEQICFEAFDAGLDGAVMRVGNLAFDSRTGAAPGNAQEITFTALLSVIARLGAIPNNLATIADLSYVDVAAEAMTALIHAESLPNSRVFHIMNGTRPELGVIQQLVGVPATPVPPEEFRSMVEREFTGHPTDESLRNCLLNAHIWDGSYGMAFSCDATSELLASLGVRWPSPQTVLARTRLDRIITH